MRSKRKKSISAKSYRKKRTRKIIAYFLIIMCLLTFAKLFLLLTRGEWNGKDKFSLVINRSDGQVMVAIFEPQYSKITNIIIPGNTEVNVSRGLGYWRIKSLWQLGKNEKLEGKLLSETVVKNFMTPVMYWADAPAQGFAEGRIGGLTKAVFGSYPTNIATADKIKLAIFSMKVKDFKRTEVQLTNTYFLKSAKLADGEDGYQIAGKLPEYLLVYFSDPDIANKNLRVSIRDATLEGAVSTKVGQIVETMGAKVASIQKLDEQELDCIVEGKDRDAVARIAKVFACSWQTEGYVGNFDMVISLGKGFAARF